MNEPPPVTSGATATCRTWHRSGSPTRRTRRPANGSPTCARRPAARRPRSCGRTGATVVALDRRLHRVQLMVANRDRLGQRDRLAVVVADATGAPLAITLRSRPGRRAVLWSGGPAPSPRRPLAHRGGRHRDAHGLQDALLARRGGWCARGHGDLQRVHVDGGRVDRPRPRGVDCAAPAGTAVATVWPRGAVAAPGRRHRWDGRAAVASTVTAVAFKAKVLTVSDGVVHGTREDRSGARPRRVPAKRPGSTWSTTGSSPTGPTRSPAALVEMANGFAGLDRVDRRHRLRAP